MTDAPLRVLLTVPNFWPDVYRGSERIVHDVAEQMARRGHAPTVVTRVRGRRPHRAVMDGFDVRYWPYPVGIDRALEPMSSFAVTAAAAGLALPVDVANAFFPSDGFGLLLAARLRRRPYVVSFHGVPDRRWWEEHLPRTHGMLLRAIHGAGAVTTLSRYCADRFAEDYGVVPTVLYPGVDLASWPRRVALDGPRVIVCTAAVDDGRKRADVLVDAFGRIAAEEPDCELLFVGPGNPAGVLARAARLPGNAGARVRCRPPLDDPRRLPDLLTACTAGCLLSEREAFGMVTLEYLAAGLPVVATGDAGMSEIVSAGTGRLVPVGDVDAAAQAIREVLRMAGDPATAERCRQRANEFSWATRIVEHERLYLEVAGRGPTTARV